MRWLVAQPGPSWSVHDVYVGWCEALAELGEDVYRFNLDDRLAFFDNAFLSVNGPPHDPAHLEEEHQFRKAVTADQAVQLAVDGLTQALWKIRPHVLLVISGHFIPHEMLDHARKAYGTHVIALHTEQPYELERELALAAHVDLNLLNDPTHDVAFEAVAPTVYAPHAYRPSVHHPGAAVPELKCDLGFVGTGFGTRRMFLELMAEGGWFDGLDVLLGGNWQGVTDDSPLQPFIAADNPAHCIDNEQTADVYRSARMGLNLYRREGDGPEGVPGWSMGPREVEMAACGLPFLRDPRPEGDRLFPMLPTFHTPDEAGELLVWHLNRPDVLREMATAAGAAVADRTFKASASKLLGLLGRRTATT